MDNNIVEQVVLQQSVAVQFMPLFLSKSTFSIYFKNKEVVQRDTICLKHAMDWILSPRTGVPKHNPGSYINISRRWNLSKVT